jgi:outer membrane protein assembly factor BamA
VRQQLLFATGEQLSAGRLEETERILRARVYLNDAWIVPVAYDAATNVVDLAVTVRDVWTLNPGLSIGRTGGANQSKISLSEQNLLGFGSSLVLSRSRDVDRTSTTISYFDPTLHGSWWQLLGTYSDNSDGRVKALSAIRPFYALDTRVSGGVIAAEATSVVSLYSKGVIVEQFEEAHNQLQAYLGGSRGLIDGWTQRWFTGVRYDEAGFDRLAMPTLQPSLLPRERTFVYPWFGWQAIEDRYVKTENLDLIGRTEDAYLGRTLYAELGYSAPQWGGLGRSWLFQANALDGWQSEDRRYLFLSATAAGRVDDGGIHNLSLSAQARYFERQSERALLYASLSGTTTHRLDGEQQLLLGGDSGLRGYPLRFQGGTSSSLLTVEERFYSHWYLLRLVRVGYAAFVDVGRTWGPDITGAAPLGLLKDVGVGVRFGNNRSGLGNVLHIDFSYVLDAPAGVRSIEVTVQTQARF